MKVIAFNGSPRVRGNTFEMLKAALSELAEKGIET
ncbi:MAG: NAD(P)H-dependent oxidoreductase, partial [bacterium]